MTDIINDDLQQIGTFNSTNECDIFELRKCSDCSSEIYDRDNYCQFCGSRIFETTWPKFKSNPYKSKNLNPTTTMYRLMDHGFLKFSIGIMLLNGILFGLFNYIQAIKKRYIIESNVDPDYADSFFSDTAILKDAIYEFIFGVINIILVWYFVSEILNLIIKNNLKDRGIANFELKRRIRILIGTLNFPLILLNLTLIILILFEENQVYLVSINYDTIIGPTPEAKLIEPFSSSFIRIQHTLAALIGVYTIYLFNKGITYLNYYGDLLKIIMAVLLAVIILPLFTVI